MKKIQYLYIACVLLLVAACKEKFNPPEADNNLNYLVVEGIINTGATDSTIIKLSRTTKLTSGITLKPEIGATVTIQSNDNAVNRNLIQTDNGKYYSVPFALDPAKKYRLRIRTLAGKEYVSDYVEAKVSPPIDEVRFEAKTNGVIGVQIYASTHDDTNKSRYYKWDYVETYQYNSKNRSTFIADGFNIRKRNLDFENINICWRNVISSNVILGSTAKLTNDVVKDASIQKVAPKDERFGFKYSIMVNQQVLTKEAFDFWEILKKNTEQVGSIFDSQPSQLQGNIHAVADPNEIVIGFINAGTVTHKRLFIDAGQLPVEYTFPFPQPCQVDTIYSQNFNATFFGSSAQIPIDGITNDASPIPFAYTTATKSCIDCRLRGTNVKPAFWQ